MHSLILFVSILLAGNVWAADSKQLSACSATTIKAKDLVQKVQDLLRSDTSVARYTMRIETPEWQRSVRLEAWEERASKRFFIRILAPRKDRDTTWLKDGSNLWMYLPKLERDIRIPPSMMLSSWMGSDFTNDDLVKMESMVEDYRHQITGCTSDEIVVTSVPKPEAAVVWGEIVHTIRSDGVPLSDDYYDEHGRHIRHLQFDQVRQLGGRMIPSRWTMQPLNTREPGRQGKQTVMLLESIVFDRPIADSVFTRANLRRKGSTK